MNQARIICTDTPDRQQLLDMEGLAALCRRQDRICISCPVEPDEGAWHFLMYKKAGGLGDSLPPGNAAGALLGVCSVVPCGEDTAECIAFTHPAARRQGVFARLLECALEQFGDRNILFPVSNHCPDACAAMDAIGAEPDSEELAMGLELEKWAATAEAVHGIRLTQVPDGQDGLTEWRLYETSSQGSLLGSCQTSALEDGSVCLHHVEVPARLRCKGCGTMLLERLFGILQQSGVKRILLHVSGDNHAALALYRKQGFRITETLSFYLY